MEPLSLNDTIRVNYELYKGKKSLSRAVALTLSLWTEGSFDMFDSDRQQRLVNKVMDSLPMEFIESLPSTSEALGLK